MDGTLTSGTEAADARRKTAMAPSTAAEACSLRKTRHELRRQMWAVSRTKHTALSARQKAHPAATGSWRTLGGVAVCWHRVEGHT
jgi:hypothetical protein